MKALMGLALADMLLHDGRTESMFLIAYTLSCALPHPGGVDVQIGTGHFPVTIGRELLPLTTFATRTRRQIVATETEI